MQLKICPKCESKEIEDITETTEREIGYFPYASPRLYQCKNCGFKNSIFPEIEKTKELHLKLKDKQ